MIKRILSFDWALWFFWIMASTWGWLVGSFFPGLTLVISGFMVAIFQWLVLQGRVSRPWRWIALTTVGWTIGYLIAFYLLPQELENLTGMVLGLTTGVAQWTILRREFHWAGWWIIFSMIGWITGLSLISGIFVTGMMAGVFTGLCLEVLLRNPKPRTIPTSPST